MDDSTRLDKPLFTLDVQLIAIKAPKPTGDVGWPDKLIEIEWNYFSEQRVELCVTPATSGEITAEQCITSYALESSAYRRFRKSELFKKLPSDSLVNDALRNEIRQILWPTDQSLNRNQIGDINQIYFHTKVSGAFANAAFLTLDSNTLRKAPELASSFNISVMSPSDAWKVYEAPFNLYQPNQQEKKIFVESQSGYLSQVKYKL